MSLWYGAFFVQFGALGTHVPRGRPLRGLGFPVPRETSTVRNKFRPLFLGSGGGSWSDGCPSAPNAAARIITFSPWIFSQIVTHPPNGENCLGSKPVGVTLGFSLTREGIFAQQLLENP